VLVVVVIELNGRGGGEELALELLLPVVSLIVLWELENELGLNAFTE
jgi:hypothetical protein